MNLYALVLAAGAGRRFGSTPKQLALHKGKPLLSHALYLANRAAPNRVHVILGCHADIIQAQLPLDNYLIHPNWAEGMGSSLAFGVKHLPRDANAVLILLADQIALTELDILTLCEQFQSQSCETAIVCAEYAQQRGVPAIFPRQYFSNLEHLTGERGAKKILANELCIAIPLPNAAIDIDTLEALQSFNQ